MRRVLAARVKADAFKNVRAVFARSTSVLRCFPLDTQFLSRFVLILDLFLVWSHVVSCPIWSIASISTWSLLSSSQLPQPLGSCPRVPCCLINKFIFSSLGFFLSLSVHGGVLVVSVCFSSYVPQSCHVIMSKSSPSLRFLL